jgi:hypothetical protein
MVGAGRGEAVGSERGAGSGCGWGVDAACGGGGGGGRARKGPAAGGGRGWREGVGAAAAGGARAGREPLPGGWREALSHGKQESCLACVQRGRGARARRGRARGWEAAGWPGSRAPVSARRALRHRRGRGCAAPRAHPAGRAARPGRQSDTRGRREGVGPDDGHRGTLWEALCRRSSPNLPALDAGHATELTGGTQP